MEEIESIAKELSERNEQLSRKEEEAGQLKGKLREQEAKIEEIKQQKMELD